MQRAQRVLMVHPSSDLYGSDRVFLDAVDVFVGQGFTVHVALPHKGHLVEQLQQRDVELHIGPIGVLRRSQLKPTKLPGFILEMLRSARNATKMLTAIQPTMVFINTMTLPLWPLVTRGRKATTIAHIHEAEASSSAFVRKLLTSPLRRVDQIIANSNVTKQLLIDSHPSLEPRTAVIHNAIRTVPEVVPPHDQSTQRLRLTYVGRISERKGVFELVNALAEVNKAGLDVHLDVIGDAAAGYDDVMVRLLALVETLGVNNNVTFHGYVADPTQLRAAGHIGVVPSTGDESFGNVAVESILAHRPVIVSSANGLLEVAELLPSCVVAEQGSSASLATAIHHCYTQRDDIAVAVEHDAEFARSYFAIERFHSEFSSIVDSVLNRTTSTQN